MRLTLSVLALVLVPAVCGSAVLGHFTLTNGGSLQGSPGHVRPNLGYDVGNTATRRVLFDEVWLDSSSVGTTLTATAASDTDFAGVAARLTNGVSDYLCVGNGKEINSFDICAPENLIFAAPSPDLGPATIERISLRVDALSFTIDPRVGEVTNFSYTITVEGQAGSVPARAGSWGRLKAAYR